MVLMELKVLIWLSVQQKYVVFSNVDGGDWGATTAMLVVRDTLGAIYGEPDNSDAVYAAGD